MALAPSLDLADETKMRDPWARNLTRGLDTASHWWNDMDLLALSDFTLVARHCDFGKAARWPKATCRGA